jgi:hypothetical protein
MSTMELLAKVGRGIVKAVAFVPLEVADATRAAADVIKQWGVSTATKQTFKDGVENHEKNFKTIGAEKDRSAVVKSSGLGKAAGESAAMAVFHPYQTVKKIFSQNVHNDDRCNVEGWRGKVNSYKSRAVGTAIGGAIGSVPGALIGFGMGYVFDRYIQDDKIEAKADSNNPADSKERPHFYNFSKAVTKFPAMMTMGTIGAALAGPVGFALLGIPGLTIDAFWLHSQYDGAETKRNN